MENLILELKNVLNYIRERCVFSADIPGDSECVVSQKKDGYPHGAGFIHRTTQLSTDMSHKGDKCGLVQLARLNARRELSHLVINAATFLHELTNFLVRVHHRRVVAVSKELADFWQRQVGEFST